MADLRLPIDDSPSSREFVFRGVQYRRADFVRDNMELIWDVFGGEDGSIIVYKRSKGYWTFLGSTTKNEGYLLVSIGKLPKEPRPYFQTHVHDVILTAFCGSKPSPAHEGLHRNDNPRDNRLANLFWGIPTTNKTLAHTNAATNPVPNKPIMVPIRRIVLTQLRDNTGRRGKDLHTLIEQIILEYVAR